MSYYEPDEEHNCETAFKLFQAVHRNANVRFETYGFLENLIYIHENSRTECLKLSESSLICLRSVLNRWYDDKIKVRENHDQAK